MLIPRLSGGHTDSMKYSLNPNPKKSACASGRGLRISTKASREVCKAVSGMRLEKGKAFLQDVIDERRSIAGKHHTNTTKEILALIKSAEANAESKGINTENLHIMASSHDGFTFYRPRAWKRRGQRGRVTNIQVVLEAG